MPSSSPACSDISGTVMSTNSIPASISFTKVSSNNLLAPPWLVIQALTTPMRSGSSLLHKSTSPDWPLNTSSNIAASSTLLANGPGTS